MYVNPYIQNTYRIKDKEERMGSLRLDMNENPEGLPEEFVNEVLQKVTAEFLATYPRKENLLELLAKREQVQVENITLTNGSDEGIRFIFETFTRPGGSVVTVTPTFEMYSVYASMFGVQIDQIPFAEDFSIDVDEILSAIHSETDLVILLNPNSPIGTGFEAEAFDRIILRAEEAGAVVLVDEAYYPFGVETKVLYCQKYSHVMVLRTFSKLCSLAALRLGYLIGSKECIHYIENAQATYNVNSVGILFAEELMKREDILQDLKQTVEEGREYLVQKLEEYGYRYYAANGNYILLKSKNSPQYVTEELKKKKILVKWYKKGMLADWIRITLGSREIMQVFWENFSATEGL